MPLDEKGEEMTETEKTLKRIEALLIRLVDKLAPVDKL